MHEITFLQDLAVVMIVAGLVTIFCHRFKQPVVLGYILAGIIIGPHTPPYALIKDEETIKTLSELGVILLMFSLGLEFSLGKLRRVGGAAFIAALLEILLMVWAGYELGRLFGWKTMDSLFLGAMLSISSTTIIIKALAELGKSKDKFADLIFAILIIEDVLAIVMIALLSGIAMTGHLNLADLGGTIGKLTVFLAAALVVGLLAIPRLIAYVAKFKSHEMLLVTVLGLCFGFALLAVKLGYSVALGSFIIGAVIAEAREIHRVEMLVEPVRDMFSAIFFVAIGLLIDPRLLVNYWAPVLIITAAVIGGKILACSFGAFIGGNDSRTSLRVGMSLAQIGEFSFIIASLGLSLKVTSDFLYPLAVAVSVLTTLTTPYLIRSTDRLVNWFDRAAPVSLVNSLEVYTRWVDQLGSERHATMAGKMARRWLWQMALNAALIAAIFVAAVLVARHPPAWLLRFNFEREISHAFLWLAAAILSLPLLIAIYRKLEALGLLVADLKITKEAAGERMAANRAIVARIIPAAGTVGLILFTLILSAPLLPPVKMLMGLLPLLALLTWLFWRSFIKIYSRAQSALKETLAEAPAPRPGHQPEAPAGLLSQANLELVALTGDSSIRGKFIREIELRSLTGASIVGIERNGVNLVNPGPDEELLAGDHLLLLGSPAQLQAARQMLALKS